VFCGEAGVKGKQAFSWSSLPGSSKNSCNASTTKNDMGTCSQTTSPVSHVAHPQECFTVVTQGAGWEGRGFRLQEAI